MCKAFAKVLIISVGTGINKTEKAVESLVHALTFSIKTHNPDKICFITSLQSQKTTLPKILEKIKRKNYETVKINDPDDIQKVYETLQPIFKKFRKRFDQVAVDYTSGTKAMTGAITILGTVYEVNTFSYVTGKRKGGLVQKGTEKIRLIQPYFATVEQKIKTAIQFFNKSQYPTAITLLTQIRKTVKDPELNNRITPILNLAKAYALWDRFQHQKAFQILKKIKKDELNPNKRFLGQLLNAKEPEPYYIADLLNNTKRRGTEEEKYDDAVARLYRTIELIAQYELKKTYNIEASNANPEQIPEELLKKWNITAEKQKIRLTLQRDYELLNAKDNPLGLKFTQDKKLKDLLTKRNTSILAHNLKPVNKKTYMELRQKVTEYASLIVKNLKQLLKDSTFIKWAY